MIFWFKKTLGDQFISTNPDTDPCCQSSSSLCFWQVLSMRRVSQLVNDQSEGAQVGRWVPQKSAIPYVVLESIPKNWMGSVNEEMMYTYMGMPQNAEPLG